MINFTEQDLAGFYHELEEPAQQRLVELGAQLDHAHESINRAYDCAYCAAIEDGEDTGAEMCEHYHALTDAYDAEHAFCEEVDGKPWVGPAAELVDYCDYSTPQWQDVPDGHYAVPDPRGVEEMTYWRRKVKDPEKPRSQDKFGPWPSKADYGPRLLRSAVPEHFGKNTPERRDYIRSWFRRVGGVYQTAIYRSILADPVAAGQRFADLTVRCCCCGRKLTNDLSKVYGIGPECRRGMPSEVLANYFRPEVGRMHAESLRTP